MDLNGFSEYGLGSPLTAVQLGLGPKKERPGGLSWSISYKFPVKSPRNTSTGGKSTLKIVEVNGPHDGEPLDDFLAYARGVDVYDVDASCDGDVPVILEVPLDVG